jgi:hypothetical protein
MKSWGSGRKFVKSSRSHFITVIVENWRDVPPSPVKVAVGTFGCCVLPFVLHAGIQ